MSTTANTSTATIQRCVYERGSDLWHLCRGKGNADFQAIACHEQEGIVLPWPRQNREPTCPDCLATLTPPSA